MFTFNKEKHEYLLDGKPLTGVTSVIGVLGKPQLIQWAANMAVDYVKTSKVWQLVPDTPRKIMIGDKELETLLEEARTAHRKKKEAAGTHGTDSHKLVEDWIKEQMTGNRADVDYKSIQPFIDWAHDNVKE